jgi:hypothetical protein
MTVRAVRHPRPTEAALRVTRAALLNSGFRDDAIASRIPERIDRARQFVVQRVIDEGLGVSNSDASLWVVIVNAWANDSKVEDPLGMVHDTCLDILDGWLAQINLPQTFPSPGSASDSVEWHTRSVDLRTWGQIDVESSPSPSESHRTGMSMILDVVVAVSPYTRTRIT